MSKKFTTCLLTVFATGVLTLPFSALATGHLFRAAAPRVETRPAADVSDTAATLHAEVNPNGAVTSYRFEYNPFGHVTSPQTIAEGFSGVYVSAYVSNLRPNTSYTFWVTAKNEYGTSQGYSLNFRTSAGSGGQGSQENNTPQAQTVTASGISQNSAIVNGQVNPRGVLTSYWFEYGPTNSLGNSTVTQSAGSGSSYSNVSAYLPGLSSNAMYYFRIVAQNQYGVTRGAVMSFVASVGTSGTAVGTTETVSLPSVVTQPATFVFHNSVLLNGGVNPNGAVTTAWFEYGPTVALGFVTAPQPAGAGVGTSPYSFALSGLLPGATYYFRAVAQSQSGKVYGALVSFETSEEAQLIAVSQPVLLASKNSKENDGVPQLETPVVRETAIEDDSIPCLVLVPSLSVAEIVPGKEFTHTVTYRNDCGFDLRKSSIKVILPIGAEFVSTNFLNATKDANVITYNLGTLSRDSEGAVSMTGKVQSSVPGSTLIFGATFQSSRGGETLASSYYLPVPAAKGGKVFTASLPSVFKNAMGGGAAVFIAIVIITFLMFTLFFKKKLTQQ